MVNLTRIYTRTGDDGTTGSAATAASRKNDPRLDAYADCDEANAASGWRSRPATVDDDVAAVLDRVQNDLFDVGADLCTPVEPDPKYPPLRVEQAQVDALEADIDRYNADLRAAAVVRAAGRYAGSGPPARRAHRRPPGRAGDLGARSRRTATR